MNILILTKDHIGLGLAHHLAQEGNSVEVYGLGKDCQTGELLYKKAENLWKSVKWCKFIIADSGDWPEIYDKAAMFNKPIIGCNAFGDLLNRDCIIEYQLGEKFGLSYPNTIVYEDCTEMYERILQWNQTRYRIKLDRQTFLCDYKEWMAWALLKLPLDKQVLLQEEVVGRNCTIMGWFNGVDWVRPFYVQTPDSESTGAVGVKAEKFPSKFSTNTLRPLKPWLKTIDYRGPISAKLVVNGEGVYIDRLYVGMTSPAVYAVMEAHRGDLTGFFHSIAFSIKADEKVCWDYLISVNVRTAEPDIRDAPIIGISQGGLKHIYFHSVYKSKGSYLASGDTNNIYTVSSNGRDMDEAVGRLKRTIGEVQFPQMAYPNNIRNLLSPTFSQMKSMGYM